VLLVRARKMKRERRPSRLSWFAFDVDAFLDDPRMQYFTAKEKGQWALILIRSFRAGGIVITDPAIIAEQLGIKAQEARQLLAKLMSTTDLLKPTGTLFEAISNRMNKEYIQAQQAYEVYSKKGKASAEKHGLNNLKIVKILPTRVATRVPTAVPTD
jgi:hypothetical protein